VSRVLFLLILIVFNLYGYVDSDLDGVDDSIDRCPNTPFSDLVDKNGCTIKSLVKNKKSKNVKEVEKIAKQPIIIKSSKIKKRRVKNHHPSVKIEKTPTKTKKQSKNHFDISLGISKFGSTTNETLSADWYHGDFSLSLFTAFDHSRSYNGSRFNDSRIWGYYNYKYNDSLMFKFGGGLIFPHIDGVGDKRVDAGLSTHISYSYNKFNPYVGVSYKFTGIDNKEKWMKNSYSIYGGTGFYLTNKLYISGTYGFSSADYSGGEDIKTVSGYIYYGIDNNWFATASYLHNLDGLDYENGFSLSIGYYY